MRSTRGRFRALCRFLQAVLLAALFRFLAGLGRVLRLRQPHLDVARGRHVGVDPTVSTVRPTPQTGSPVNLDVRHDQPVYVQPAVVGVAFAVLQHLQQELGRLLGPAPLGGFELLGLGAATDSAVEAPEGNALLMGDHVLQVGDRALQGHLLDGVCGLAGVLEVHAEVGASRFARFCGDFGFSRVSAHGE